MSSSTHLHNLFLRLIRNFRKNPKKKGGIIMKSRGRGRSGGGGRGGGSGRGRGGGMPGKRKKNKEAKDDDPMLKMSRTQRR